MSFDAYVRSFEDLFWKNRGGARGSLQPLHEILTHPIQRILVIAPHPDDECLMSGLAVRAKHECGAHVSVVPFTYGSKLERQLARKSEMSLACKALGFDLIETRTTGLGELTADEMDRAWVQVNPDTVILPHLHDGHPAHSRASVAGREAAQRFKTRKESTFALYYSEFWQSMENPNIKISLSAEQVTQMGEALLKHDGEVTRNPYHLYLPAYFMDQQRRGSEAVLGQAGTTPVIESPFAQIYRVEMF